MSGKVWFPLRGLRKSVAETVTSEQRFEGSKGMSLMEIQGGGAVQAEGTARGKAWRWSMPGML